VWHLVDADYETVAEIRFNDEKVDDLPTVIVLNGIRYFLDRKGGFFMREPETIVRTPL
jgi:hypothetical protein